MNRQEDILTQRIHKIKDWAMHNDFTFREEHGKGKIFTINGKNGERLVSIFQNSSYKGNMYVYIADRNFPGNLDQRDIFVNELNKSNLLNKSIDATKIIECKTLEKKIEDLTDDELINFLSLISNLYNDESLSEEDISTTSRSSGDYLPTKDDFETAYRIICSPGNKIHIDSVLDQIEKSAINLGHNLKGNWRLITEENIEKWIKEK